MSFVTARRPFLWQLRNRRLELGERTLLMGILNVTPDSFSDGAQFMPRLAAIAQGLRLLDQGADILDIGGESTRPDAKPLSPKQEQERVIPILAAILKARPDAILSIDSYHASTARQAIEAGAEIINDVSGLLWDDTMAAEAADLKAALVLNHTRGKPQQWASLPPLDPAEVLPVVLAGLHHALLTARTAGVEENRIMLDPGFGFGKLGDDNFVLHALLPQLHQLGLPILVGTSRKRFLDRAVRARLGPLTAGEGHSPHASNASNVAAILAGAHILRVHDILPASEAAAVADAILLAAGRPVDTSTLLDEDMATATVH